MIDLTEYDSEDYEVTRNLHYAGIATYAGCEFTRDLEGADFAVMGVPFDVGTSNHPGAREAPRALRDVSRLVACFYYPWDYDIFTKRSIIDYGDVGFYDGPDATSKMIEGTYRHAKRILAAGVKLLTIGGDHTIPYGMVRAAYEKYGKLALIHFDSHTDCSPSEPGTVFHGNFAYDLMKEGCIDASKSAQVFIRTNMNECGYNIVYAQEAVFMDMDELAEKIKAIVGDMPVYLTFDIDALDPAFAPGTGTPVSGGPSTAQVIKLLHALCGINVVAADLVEVLPALDPSHVTALAGATVAQSLLYLMDNATGE